MKKKKLNLDNLKVQSFVTTVESEDVKGGVASGVACLEAPATTGIGTFHVCHVPSEPVYNCHIPSFNAACTTPIGSCIATDTCAVA